MKRQAVITQNVSTVFYSAVHLLVDLSCAYLMFRHMSAGAFWYPALFLYNFCAFALQLPLGILADRTLRPERWAALGCLLCALALVPWSFGSLPVLAAGMGNALFHVAGGTQILRESGYRCAIPGIFVSTGAIGIFLGTMWGRGGENLSLALLLILLLAGFLLCRPRKYCVHQQGTFCGHQLWKFCWHRPGKPALEVLESPSVRESGKKSTIFALACLFLVVVLRSYQGMISNFPWKTGTSAAILVILGTAAGKCAGGFLSDRFGLRPTAAVSLSLSALLFLASGHPWAGVAAIFLFNMTMPMTLTGIYRLFPGQPGFSFGLLTFALFLGFLPVYGGCRYPEVFSPRYLALLTLLSLALALAGLSHRAVSTAGRDPKSAEIRRERP